ncbi:hypothetical protein [uncultured Amaricoccus sp.]|uniref:hypothetical protein n=2 Tax=Amaricoccus TaxID=56999 RepID=UPI002628BAE2|nr:hypothetical protein [uncultured Amaricoccus sp.]
MMDKHALKQDVIADARAGASVSAEDVAIAALVMMPFTLTLFVFLSWVTPLSNFWLQFLWLIVTAVATMWNAGWRARTSA